MSRNSGTGTCFVNHAGEEPFCTFFTALTRAEYQAVEDVVRRSIKAIQLPLQPDEYLDGKRREWQSVS